MDKEDLAQYQKFLKENFKLNYKQSLEMLANLQVEHFSEGDVLLKEGDNSEFVYIVVEGELTVFKKDKELAKIEPGGIAGEMSAVGVNVCSATVTVSAKSILMKIEKLFFEDFLDRNPDFNSSIMYTVLNRRWEQEELV